ncbi:helix-turn-helix domain containing protein [Amycolatopsis cynarae]|uniref:Helix-turn-helix domain containing protein n=1 Tax=Amycolatopsis cynarae TaxID=2995223 RepID=A0ABY7BA87_9PSEU|nr:TetR/AcrR family transcriptional regulator [Amycolatopsis sp. HUAS 11-8]WAL69266.1 helix-turn-helix domain containing protein [Amycolatopsis sp. HUAS 11-8]
MPKITAGSVREQREQRLGQLIAAAEAILAEDGVAALTAGAVARRAGLARNSIYRYFSSIDELVELIVTREFPAWIEAVTRAVEAQRDPVARAVAYVVANLDQAAKGTHGHRVALARGALSASGLDRVRELHTSLASLLDGIVSELDPGQPRLVQAVLQSLVDACVRRIDAGDEHTAVLAYARRATTALLQSS